MHLQFTPNEFDMLADALQYRLHVLKERLEADHKLSPQDKQDRGVTYDTLDKDAERIRRLEAYCDFIMEYAKFNAAYGRY